MCDASGGVDFISGAFLDIAERRQAEQALHESENPSIVLTDIEMPAREGFSVLGKSKAIRPETELIVTTGHGDKDLEKRAVAWAPAPFSTNRWIPRPWTPR